MRQILKNISPFNNRTEMPPSLFVIKKILAFWLCYIVGLFAAEGVVIFLHFALGKNVFAGELFDTQTITIITYYGYIVMAGVALFYWKMIEKKQLYEMGLTKRFGDYLRYYWRCKPGSHFCYFLTSDDSFQKYLGGLRSALVLECNSV